MADSDFIAERVAHFIAAPREYALLINGPWGIGKTYYCRTVLAPLVESIKGKKPSFVSLFGVSSIKDFDRRLIEGIAPLLATSAGKVTSAAISGAAKKFVGIEFDPTALMDALKGEVVFIDDLERCHLEIREVFGYVDNLISRYNIHAIVVGFEDEFAKNQPSYGAWKEKLIGFTYEYRPNFLGVAQSVITSNMRGDGAEWKAKILREEYKSAFLDRQEESPNFRTLRVATDAWSVVAEHLAEPTTTNRDAYKWLLWTILAIVTETRRNEALWPRLQSAFAPDFDFGNFHLEIGFRNAQKQNLPPDLLEGFIDQWFTGAPSAIFKLEEVASLLRTGKFDATNFAAQFDAFIQASTNRPPAEPVERLFGHLWQLSDDERHSTTEDALKEIDEGRITDVYQLVRLADVLHFLADARLIKYSTKEVLERALASLRKLKAEGRIAAESALAEIPRRFSPGSDASDLAAFKKEALELSQQVSADAKVASLRDIFEGFAKPGHSFADIGREGRHMTAPVFVTVPTDVVVSAVSRMPTEKVAELTSAVRGRYSYSNVRDFMLPEWEALTIIGKEMRALGEAQSSPRRMRDYQMELLGELFLKTAERLEPTTSVQGVTPD